MKNSLIVRSLPYRDISCVSGGNDLIGGMYDGQPLIFTLRREEIQPGLFFIVAEKRIDPAPDRVSG